MIQVDPATIGRGQAPRYSEEIAVTYKHQREADDAVYAKAFGYLILAAVILAVMLVIVAIRDRRRITASLDSAAVSALASTVRAKRTVAGKASAYRQRIMDRVDDPGA